MTSAVEGERTCRSGEPTSDFDPQRTSKTGHTRRTIGSAPDEATGTTEAAIEDRETARAERRKIQGKLSRAAR